MALTTCKDCNNEVSTDAKTCPKCGAKVVKPKPPKKPTSMATWLIGAIVLGGILLSVANQPQAPQVAAKTPEQKAATAKKDIQLQMAASGAMNLKKSSKDPDSFELKRVVLHPNGVTCYDFRAANSFNAKLKGSAILTADGKMLIEESGGNKFVDAWNKNCTTPDGDDVADYLKRSGIV